VTGQEESAYLPFRTGHNKKIKTGPIKEENIITTLHSVLEVPQMTGPNHNNEATNILEETLSELPQKRIPVNKGNIV